MWLLASRTNATTPGIIPNKKPQLATPARVVLARFIVMKPVPSTTKNVLSGLTRELTDLLRKNKTIDWQQKQTARAKMRMMVKRLLKRYKYPPDDQAEALETVISQCEMWTDNTDLSAASDEGE